MISLTNEISLKSISNLEVRAVHFEQNLEAGQQWVDVYGDYGFLKDETFFSFPVPGTGSSILHFRFENGMHPAKPGKMLGRCAKCGQWFFAVSGVCSEVGCTGTIAPYPAYDDFRAKIESSTERDIFKATEEFLTNAGGKGLQFPNTLDIKVIGALVKGSTIAPPGGM